MKKFFLELPVLHQMEAGGYYWKTSGQSYPRIKLRGNNVENAFQEAQELFRSHKKEQMQQLTSRSLPSDQRNHLIGSFPRKIQIIEEIIHEMNF